MHEAYEVATGVGLGVHPETGAPTAVPVVTVKAPQPLVAMSPDTVLELAENLADAADAAMDDAHRVQDAIDAGETDQDRLAAIAADRPDPQPDAGCPHVTVAVPCSDCAGDR